MKEKTKKENRIRLGGGGPHVKVSTNDEINRRMVAFKISRGKVIDNMTEDTNSKELK